MLWRTEGTRLEDLLPVPNKQPGRHFSSGYHMLGHVASSYDVKYAHMTYGDHYRKKIVEEIERERNRLEDALLEPKRQAREQKQAMTAARKTAKRYDMNELRHNQRRCAALLFGARQKGSHEVPYMVRWAPRRRESYYLMSERVYNDRLLMKLREEEEAERRRMLASPIDFDFADNIGDTSHLYDFQKLISKTSKTIKGLSFDAEYKDYDYDFKEGERKTLEGQQGVVSLSPSRDEGKHTGSETQQSEVHFSDITDYESDGIGGRLSRERRRANREAKKSNLDTSDIELGLLSPADFQEGGGDNMLLGGLGEEDSHLSDLVSELSLHGGRSRGSKPKGSSRSRQSGAYNSRFGDGTEGFSLNGVSSVSGKSIIDEEEVELEDEEDGVSGLGGAHNNKYCKHSPTSSMKKRAQDYYKTLPRLLRTSELRKKATAARPQRQTSSGAHVTHDCMASHKTAYERALALVRGRSLPFDYTELSNRTTRRTFSYMPGMPGTESTFLEGKTGEIRHFSKSSPGLPGMKGILGDVDMNDFYREEDELIYYMESDELKNVVPESTAGRTKASKDDMDDDDTDDDDDDNDDDDNTSGDLTTATTESYTRKPK